MSMKKTLGLGLLGTSMVALGGVAAASVVGNRLRRRHDDRLDDPLDPPTDVTHHHISTHDGGVLHAVEMGTGDRTLVLMHGVTLQWWVWSAVMKLAATDHRVIAWDMRGHGESRAGSEGATLEAVADDLDLLLMTLDVEHATLVGHSMGGMALGQFHKRHLQDYEQRVDALMFLATSAAPASAPGIAGALGTVTRATSRLAQAAVERPRLGYHWGDNGFSATLVGTAFGPAVTGRMISDVRHMLADCPQLTLAQSSGSIAVHDVREDLAGVRLPTMVVVGSHDRLTPPLHARTLAAIIPGAELVTLPGIGHQVMQEAPDALVELIGGLEARS